MANAQTTVEIIFGAIDNTGGALQSVSGGIDSMTSSISGVTGPLSDLADKAIAAQAAAMAMGAALAGIAINEAGQFQSRMTEIGTLFNATPADVERLSQSVLDFAQSSTSDIGTIQTALYDAISATGDWENSIEFLAAAQIAANAGASDLGTAVDALTSVLNSYGMDVSQAGAVTDDLFTIVQQGKTTLPELAASIGQVASTAAAAGVDFQTVGAAIAALTGAGISTSESMTRLKALFTELAKPGTDLQAALGGMSLEADGLGPIMERLAAETGGSFEAMAQLFGSVEAANAALILANDTSGKFSGSLAAMAENAGAAAAAAAQIEQQYDALNQTLANNLRVSMITLGADLLSAYGDVVNSIVELLQGITVGVDTGALDPLTSYFTAKAGELSELMRGIADALPEAMADLDYSGLTSAFDGLISSVTGLFDAFFGDLDLTTPEGLTEALQKLIDSFETLTQVVAGIADSWEPTIRAAGEWVDTINDSDDGAKELVGNILGLAQQFEAFKGAIEGVSGGLNLLGGAITLLAGVQGFPLIATGVTAATGAIQAFIASVGASGLAAALGAAGAAVAGVTFGVTQNMQAWQDLQARNAAAEAASNSLADSQTRLSTALNDINSTLGTSFTSMTEFNQAVDSGAILFDQTTSTWRLAGEAMGDMGENARAAGADLITAAEAENQATNAMAAAKQALADKAGAAEQAGTAQQGYLQTVENGVPVFSQFGTALAGTQGALKETGKQTDEAREKTDAFLLKMAEIESKERQVMFELAADVKVAQIEADAERVVAAFESVGASITSNNELVGSLAQTWGGLDDMRDKWTIEDLMDKAETRAQEAHDQQMKMLDAELARVEAQTKALARGDALIQIDGTGLEPELEAFMWQILKRIRVQANAEFQDYLLGMGVGEAA